MAAKPLSKKITLQHTIISQLLSLLFLKSDLLSFIPLLQTDYSLQMLAAALLLLVDVSCSPYHWK